MIKYKNKVDYKSNKGKNSRWLTLYISMILIVLTFFISLSAYSIRTFEKMKKFQKAYNKSLVFSKGKSKGKISITNFGEGDRLSIIINELREKGLSKKKLNEYLKESDLINLGVRVGEDGYTLIVPTKVVFLSNNTIDPKSYVYLTKIGYLARYLPYYVYIEGYVLKGENIKGNPWSVAAQRAYEIYKFFKSMKVAKEKMIIAGFATNNAENSFLKIRFEKEE